MSAELDTLQELLIRVSSMEVGWQSMDVACTAVRKNSEWVHLVGRARLITEPWSESRKLRRLVDLESFRAYGGRLRVDELAKLFQNLRDGWVLRGLGDDDVRLVPTSAARGYSWASPHLRHSTAREGWPASFGTWGTGDGSSILLPPEFWQQIDRELFQHDPPYNGLAGLCGGLDIEFSHPNNGPYFSVLADLHARFTAADADFTHNSCRLSVQFSGSPIVLVDWLPSHAAKRIPTPKRESPGNWEVTIPIPPGATALEAKLLFGGAEADRITYGLDRPNTLLRIAHFFDPHQERLNGFLFTKTDSDSNPFELAVARLLGTAGFVVLWFGKASKDALPDAVAYWRSPRGEERIILAECTMKEPTRKLSDLAARAQSLIAEVGLDPKTFRAVLFVRANALEPDFEAAVARGVALCDGAELGELRTRILEGYTPEDVFQAFNAVFDSVGMPLRFRPSWSG